MNKKFFFLFILACVVIGLGFVIGCANLGNLLNGSTTNLTSSSLEAANALRAQGITIHGTKEVNNWLITPTKISGKVLSVVLPINDQEDEGIVPFGDGRPDIAPAQSTLRNFDLSEVTTLKKEVISTKPGFVGGECGQIILLFGYFDVEFLRGTTGKKIRFCYGDTDPYSRGDKLLYNADDASTGSYYWYDTSAEAFVVETATRPTYPSANAFVRDFSDEVRPNMHYYMLGAQLRNNTDYDGDTKGHITLSRSIVEDNELAFTVDFDVENSVVFTNVASAGAFEVLTDAQLIQKFDMKQNVSNWGNSNLYCSITFEATPKFK